MGLFWFEIRYVFLPVVPGCGALMDQSFGSTWIAMFFIISFVLDFGKMNEAGSSILKHG